MGRGLGPSTGAATAAAVWTQLGAVECAEWRPRAGSVGLLFRAGRNPRRKWVPSGDHTRYLRVNSVTNRKKKGKEKGKSKSIRAPSARLNCSRKRDKTGALYRSSARQILACMPLHISCNESTYVRTFASRSSRDWRLRTKGGAETAA